MGGPVGEHGAPGMRPRITDPYRDFAGTDGKKSDFVVSTKPDAQSLLFWSFEGASGITAIRDTFDLLRRTG